MALTGMIVGFVIGCLLLLAGVAIFLGCVSALGNADIDSDGIKIALMLLICIISASISYLGIDLLSKISGLI